jgi:hypothetical protein
LNTEEFYKRFPHLLSDNVCRHDILLCLEKLTPLDQFDLMVETDMNVLDNVRVSIAEYLLEERK